MHSYRILVSALLIACSLLLAGSFLKVPSAAASPSEENMVAYPCYYVNPSVDPLVSGFTVDQIRSAYNLPSGGGSGTIAIIDAYNASSIRTDLAVFNAQFGLPDANLEIYNMSTRINRDSGWALETALDVEWAHAIAPNAKILLVQARSNLLGDLLNAVDYARSRTDVVAISMSWGSDEFSTETLEDPHFSSVSGATFFASSGDAGSGTIWPSTSPNVVAVGGTVLSFSGGTLSSETGWSGSGGGISTYEPLPAYQATYGVPASRRAVPDVSYNAVNFPVYISGSWTTVGGTSAGAPQWAAIQALGLTASNDNFYQDAKLSSYSSYFRDITVGSNGGFSATTGYDFVTGVGSPLTTNFTPSGNPATTVTLIPAGQSTPLSPSNVFSVSYTNSGIDQTDSIQSSITLNADSGTNIVISGASTGSSPQEKWVFNSNADSITIAAGSSTTLYYYDLLVQTANYTTLGGGTPPNPNLTYLTAPTLPSGSSSQTSTSLQLLQTPAQTFWALRGSGASVTNPLVGNSLERWSTQITTWAITAPNLVPSPIAYYHQYLAAITYQVSGGGTPTSPTLTVTSLGTTSTTPIPSTLSSAWLDAGSSYALSNPLPSSTSTERWLTPATTSGVANGAVTVSATFYHQFTVSAAYLLIGGGNPTAPFFSYTRNGIQTAMQLNTTQQQIWADSTTSYSTPPTLGDSTATERWTTLANSGTVQAAATLVFTYYHQFNVSAAYSLVGGGTPTAPNLSTTSFGNPATLTMANAPQSVWADTNTPYIAPAQLGGSTAIQRWTALANTGTVQGPTSLNITYYRQFLLNVTGAQTSSQWFNSNETAQIALTGVFNRTQGTGQRITNYTVDNGIPSSLLPTAGQVQIFLLMDAPHQLQINSVTQYQITLDVTASRLLSLISPTTISGDNYWYDAGTPISVALKGVSSRLAGAGERLTSYSVNGAPTNVSTLNPIGVLNIASLLSPQTVSATATSQYQLTTSSGSIRSTTAPSITGDTGWYDAGTPVTVTYDYTWNTLQGQSRLNAINYAVDQGASIPLTRSNSGTFSVQTTMSHPESITISSVNQYPLTLTGGNNVVISQPSPTGDSFYDSGTTLSVNTNNVWDIQGGNTRQNLISYTLDGTITIVPRANTGKFSTPLITFNNAHVLALNSVTQYIVTLDSVTARMLFTITPPMINGDNYWYDAGTPLLVVLNGVGTRSAGTGERLTSYSVNGVPTSVSTSSPVEVLNLAALLTPQTITALVTQQYQLSTLSGSIKSITPPSLTGDANWYDTGTAVTVTYDYTWSNTGQSRLNAVGYTITPGGTTTLSRSSSGEFFVQVIMARPETINISIVTQYSFSSAGGNNVILSQVSPTGDLFYDSGATLSVTTDNAWGSQTGNTRQNLVSYTLDGATTNVTRADTGVFTTPTLTFDRSHALIFNSATQYFIAFQFTDNNGTNNIIPSTFQINIGSSVINLPQFSTWIDSGTTIQIHSIIWENVDVKPTGPTAYTVTSPLNVTIQCRIFNAQIKILNSQGNPAAGAQVTVTIANQTTIDAAADVNGTVNLQMIPLGTFNATIVYSGLTATISGDASSQTVTTMVISPPPSPTASPAFPTPTPIIPTVMPSSPAVTPTPQTTTPAPPTVSPQIPELPSTVALCALIAATVLLLLALKKRPRRVSNSNQAPTDLLKDEI